MSDEWKQEGADFSKRMGRVLAWIAVGVLVLAGVGFYGIENFRGRVALEEAYALATADPWPEGFGEEAELRDEGNVYGAPILACLNDFDLNVSAGSLLDLGIFRDTAGIERLRAISLPLADRARFDYYPKTMPEVEPSSPPSESPVDLVVWAALLREAEGFEIPDRSASPSRQILAAFDGRFGAELAELAEAAKRPRSLVTSVFVEEGFFEGTWFSPHHWTLRPLFDLLLLRMAAAVDAGDAAVFHESFTIHLRLVEGILADRNTSNAICVLAEVPRMVRAVQFALHRGQWTAEDLLALQGQLASLSLREPIELSFRLEIEFTKRRFEGIRKQRELAQTLYWDGSGHAVELRIAKFAPGGWIDLNAAEAIRWTHSFGVLPWRKLDFASWTGLGASPLDFKKPETFLLAKGLIPETGFSMRLAQAYLQWEMAQIACALEAHRIVHGAYPDSLGSLGIEIPRDPFAKDALRYFTEGTGYRLYSVGWNRRDDLGVVSRDKQGRLNREAGDWVWGEGDLPREWVVENRKKAILRIRLEEERGEPLSDKEFEMIWSGQGAKKSDPTTENLRRERILKRMQEKIRKDAAKPKE